MQTFKHTAKTIILSLLIFALLSDGLFQLFFRSENHVYQDIRERAELAGTLDALVVGASYAKRALIPEEMDRVLGTSTYNLSASEMTMQGRYQMLYEEITRNPVKTVYIELSMKSMSVKPYEKTKEGDLYVIPRLDSSVKRIKYALTSFKPKDYGWLYRHLLSRTMTDVEALFTGDYVTRNHYQMRGYIPFEDDVLEYVEIKKTPFESYHTSKISKKRYDRNVEYLEKIIRLCREYGAEPIIVSMPMSEFSISKYTNIQKIHDYYQEVADEHGLKFFDFNLWKDKTLYLTDDKYHNPTHLDDELAPVFSEQFGLIMKTYFEGRDVSGYFYPDFKTLCTERGYKK